MRILHCVPSFYGAGAEKLLAGLAIESKRLGTDVHISFVGGGPHLQLLDESGVRLHPIGARGLYDPRIPARIGYLVRRLRPDLVHSWLTQSDISAGFPAQLLGVPHVIAEGSSAALYRGGWKNALRVALGRRAAGIVANSEGGAAYWAEVAPATPRWVIPNGLPLDEIEAAPALTRAQMGAHGAEPLILYVGRLQPEKNTEGTARGIFDALRRTDARAVFCGYGPSQARVTELAREAGVADRVSILGFVPSVWPYMKAADVLVSTTPFEGRPNVVLEAVACGCPLVVSDIPAHREFLSERSALLVPHTDPGSIGAAILGVLHDPRAAAERAAEAARAAGLLSLRGYAEAHESVYEEILRARRPRSESGAAGRGRAAPLPTSTADRTGG